MPRTAPCWAFQRRERLAATGIAGRLLAVFNHFFIGFSSGVSAVAARLFGQGDALRLRMTETGVFCLVLLVGLLLSCLCAAACVPLLRLLRCPEAVLPPDAAYLRVCCCGIPAQFVCSVSAAVLRSLGDSRGPLKKTPA